MMMMMNFITMGEGISASAHADGQGARARERFRSAAGPTNVQQPTTFASTASTPHTHGLQFIYFELHIQVVVESQSCCCHTILSSPTKTTKPTQKQTIKNGCPRRCPCKFGFEASGRAGAEVKKTDVRIRMMDRPVFSLVSRPGSCSSTLVRTR